MLAILNNDKVYTESSLGYVEALTLVTASLFSYLL